MGYLNTIFIAAIKPSQIVLDYRTKTYFFRFGQLIPVRIDSYPVSYTHLTLPTKRIV